MTEEQYIQEDLFAVFAVRKNNATPLIQTHMPFRRLMDEIVVPYETNETFFIDGAPIKSTDLDRIKLIKQKEAFEMTFGDLHHGMRFGRDIKKQELYAKQYHIRLEALLRESGDDVTSQIINAYKTVIKPKLKDYLPNRDSLLDAAVKVFAETMKALSGS